MFASIKPYLGKYSRLLYSSVFVMLFAIALSVMPYLMVYYIISPLLQGEAITLTSVLVPVLMILVGLVGYALFYVLGLDMSHRAAYNTLKNIRVSLQKRMESQPLGVIMDRGVGSTKKMFIDDIESIELLLAHAIPEGLANLGVPIFIIIAMFFVDWRLALLSIASIPFGLFAMGAMFRQGVTKMDAYYGAAQKMNDTIIEYINGMEVVKVFNKEGESSRRFENDVRSYRDFTLAWYKACWPWMALYTSILPTIAAFTLPIGACLVLSGTVTLADFVLVLCMSFSVGTPLIKSMSFMSTIPQLNYKIATLDKRMNAQPLKQGAERFTGVDHTVRFEDVSFSYKEAEVLHSVSLEAREGCLTALVGPSGSGKSTLARLLVHYYDIDSGKITIGGQDITSMRLETLNDLISYVSQEQFLFNTTLMENIRMGRLDATDEEVRAAAEKAQCDEFLKRLPLGLMSLAGDSGKELSGGERQRITLARAILKDAPIIVLDEATAYMDPENEEKMNEAIANVIKDKTVIVIAHRLYTIADADAIALIDDGRVEAVGRQEELMAASSLYAHMYEASEESAAWGVSKGDVQ